MRPAALVDEHLDRRVLLEKRARGSGMIEMDVGEQDLADVAIPMPLTREAVAETRSVVEGPGSISATPDGACSTAVAMMPG